MTKVHSALKILLVKAEHIREKLIKAERVAKWEMKPLLGHLSLISLMKFLEDKLMATLSFIHQSTKTETLH